MWHWNCKCSYGGLLFTVLTIAMMIQYVPCLLCGKNVIEWIYVKKYKALLTITSCGPTDTSNFYLCHEWNVNDCHMEMTLWMQSLLYRYWDCWHIAELWRHWFVWCVFVYTQVVGLSGGWAPKTQDFDVGHLCSCPGLHCSGGGWVLNSSLHQCCTLHGSVITVRHTILINTLFLTHNTNYLHSHFRFDTFSLTKYDTSLKTVDLYVIS